jgi:hypothetical protein
MMNGAPCDRCGRDRSRNSKSGLCAKCRTDYIVIDPDILRLSEGYVKAQLAMMGHTQITRSEYDALVRRCAQPIIEVQRRLKHAAQR